MIAMVFTTPLRYPGGKARLTSYMQEVLAMNELCQGTYVEPYAGGAGMAINLLLNGDVDEIVINDADPAIYCFWKSVTEETEGLVAMIDRTDVSMDTWLEQRAVQNNMSEYTVLEIGFSTFFLNRTNRSGILKGGVIGGKSQKGEYRMDARFNKRDLITRIERIAERKNSIRVMCSDGIELLDNPVWDPSEALVYIDPPYYKKGSLLYMNHYGPEDHRRLSECIRKTRSKWILSYDDVPQIRELYGWADPIEFQLRYGTSGNGLGNELFFASDELLMPNEEVRSYRGGCSPRSG